MKWWKEYIRFWLTMSYSFILLLISIKEWWKKYSILSKREIYQVSLLVGSFMWVATPISRFCKIGTLFVRTKVQLAKQRQSCNNGRNLCISEKMLRNEIGEITKSWNRDFDTFMKHKSIFYFGKHCDEVTMSI